MKVLNLVTTRRPFFDKQIDILESKGVTTEVITVPGREDAADERGYFDYLRFYRSVLSHSTDDVDIVHANYGLTAPFALLQPHRPVVLSLWGSDLMGKYAGLSRRCVPFCDEAIVMSPDMAEELESDPHVIPHAVDSDLFRPIPREDAQRELGWEPEKRHVLFPYHPSRSTKNYPLAEKVVKATNERIEEDVELHAVSGVDHGQVPTYMNAAHALLLTSRREGSPNSIKEALACNLPIVATDVGDIQQRVSGVERSFVCRSEDQLIDSLYDILTEGDRSNGREEVRELSLDRMGDRILKVYEQTLE